MQQCRPAAQIGLGLGDDVEQAARVGLEEPPPANRTCSANSSQRDRSASGANSVSDIAYAGLEVLVGDVPSAVADQGERLG